MGRVYSVGISGNTIDSPGWYNGLSLKAGVLLLRLLTLVPGVLKDDPDEEDGPGVPPAKLIFSLENLTASTCGTLEPGAFMLDEAAAVEDDACT